MKKKGYQGILRILFGFSLILFFSSCGLPVYYIIYPPVSAGSSPADIQDRRFFSFRTADNLNKEYAKEIYRGIDVYYKIYNSEKDRDSDIQQIQAANSEFSQSGFTKLKSLEYEKLVSKPSLHDSTDILFNKNNNDINIKIRLFDEGNDYKAGFEINDIVSSGSKPIRSNGKNFQFEESYLPGKGDPDYKHNEEESDYFWVTAYAVSVGRDGFFQPYYSSLLPLGSIKIPKDTIN